MLRVENIEVKYREFKALEDVSFEIEKGKFIGIIGPNGAGKTTLLNTIAKVLTPKKGAIFVNGRNISDMSRKEIAKIMGIVPQHTQITGMFTIYDVVMMGRYPHTKSRFNLYGSNKDIEVVNNVIRLCEIEDIAAKNMDEVSGGQLQKAIIARALAQEPKILLLDEPTSNLDPKYQLKILNLIKNLVKNDGMTVIMTIHDLNAAARFCDTLIMVHNHKIYAIGKPEEVLTKENIKEVYGVDAEIHYVDKINSIQVTLIDVLDGKREEK